MTDKAATPRNISLDINQFITGFSHGDRPGQSPEKPCIFIVGTPRSGTTLLYQYLASTGRFSFPTNLMSGFYGSARFAASVQLLFTDPSQHGLGKISSLSDEIDFTSEYGKTHGLLQPSEFWYFWRRFFPLDVPAPLQNQSIQHLDIAGFQAELADLEFILQKPLLLKGLLLCFNLKLLAELVERPIFIYIHRDERFNAQSMLLAREKILGSREEWYSAKPREYEWLKNLCPVAQVVGQIHFTNNAISRQLAELSHTRQITIEYESFCQNPNQVLLDIERAFESTGFMLEKNNSVGELLFNNANRRVIDAEEFQLIDDMLNDLNTHSERFQQKYFRGASS